MAFFQEFKSFFPELIGNYHAKLALILNLIDQKCGGVLLIGKRGVGKSLLLKLFKKFLNLFNLSYIEIPLNVTEENLIGGIDIEKTLEKGIKVYQEGLLEKAKNSYVLIEEINLLPTEYLSLIFQTSYNYTIIATMNPEEGSISPHFLDKMGMCVYMERIDNFEDYSDLLRLWGNYRVLDELYLENYEKLYRYVSFVKACRSNIGYEDTIWDYIVEVCLKNMVSTHRAEIFLFFAARAFAAMKGEGMIKPEHVNFVAPLVLLHRKREIEEKPKPQNKEEENQQNLQKNQNLQKEPPKNPPSKGKDSKPEREKEEKELSDLKEVEIVFPSIPKEEVFELGEVFKPKRIFLRKDRIARTTSGRRTKSKTLLKGGRFIRSVMFSKDKDVDLFGTIKTAAPFQKLRGRKDKLVIYKEDIRYKEKENKIGHLVVFVTDGSGSMAANQRMIATKGAIMSLLMDCYQKRDKVAMILFRKFKAEVVLPPTSSVELAHKKLKDLPTGGNTPLSAGLLEAYKLIKKYHLKFPKDRILLVVITDGKANIPIKFYADPLKEVQNISQEIKNLPYIETIVVDTEVKSEFLRMDLAKDLAQWLSATYIPLEDLKAESLTNLIIQKKESQF